MMHGSVPRGIVVLLLLAALAGCTKQHAVEDCSGVDRSGLSLSEASATLVGLATTKGCIVVELYEAEAPITAGNFRTYVEESWYTNLLVHRVVPGVVIQSGGMRTSGQFKEATHPPIENEARSSGLRNLAYTLAMARTQEPHSATTQFFVNLAANPSFDPGGATPDGYAVFGLVVEGRDVVDVIAGTPTVTYQEGQARGYTCQPDAGASCPTESIVLFSASVI